MRALVRLALLFGVAAAIVAWFLSRPASLPEDWGAGLTGDAEAGQLVFAAGGCAACHTAPSSESASPDESDRPPVLSGGQAFASDFGTFYASNITSDPKQGIGGWTLSQFARALTLGVSPDGRHYYPAFPYPAYSLAEPQDVADLFVYLRTLPGDDTPSRAHDVAFPFSIRRGIGLWKAVHMPAGFTVSGDLSAQQERGRYLAEALGHCAECHTPRNALGGLDRSRWMRGAPDPSGVGKIPGITRRDLDWSQADLAEYFKSGFTPEYDTAGDGMADVVKNLARLTQDDRDALAAYVAGLP